MSGSSPTKAGSIKDLGLNDGDPRSKKTVRMTEEPVLEEVKEDAKEGDPENGEDSSPEGPQERSTQTGGGLVQQKTNLFKNPLHTSGVPTRDDLTIDVMTCEFVRNKQFDAALETLEGREDPDAMWFRARILKMADHHYRNHPSEAPTNPDAQTSILSRSSADEGIPELPDMDPEVMAERLVRDFALLHNFELKSEVESSGSKQKSKPSDTSHAQTEAYPSRPLSPQDSVTSHLSEGAFSKASASVAPGSATKALHHLPWVESASTIGSQASFDLAAGVRRARSTTPGIPQDSWEAPVSRASYGSCRSFSSTPSRLYTPSKALPHTISNLGVRHLNSPHFAEVQRAIAEATRRASAATYPGSSEPAARTISVAAPTKSSVRMARDAAYEAADRWREQQQRGGTPGAAPGAAAKISFLTRMRQSPLSSHPEDGHHGPDESPAARPAASNMLGPAPSSGADKGSSPFQVNKLHRMQSRTLSIRRKSQDAEKGEPAEKANGAALSPRTLAEVWTACSQWEQCRDIRAEPMDSASKTRKDATDRAQAQAKEAIGPGKEGLHKMSKSIKHAVKKDEVGKTLQDEENETQNMLATLSSIEDMLTKLYFIRSERQKKKVHERELIVKQAQEEMDRISKRLERDVTNAQHSAEAASNKTEELVFLRDKLERSEEDIKALETQVDLLRNQVANAEGKAFLSQSQGLMNAAKEAEAKANRLRKEYQAVRDRVAVKVKDCAEVRKAVEACVDEANECDMVSQKDDHRAGESKKANEKEKRKMDELKSKLAVERETAQELSEQANEQEQSAERAKELQADQGHTISGLLVTDRLRAKSLSVIAKNLLTTIEVPRGKLVKEPVFVGQKQEGLRHGFGCIEYPEGAEFRGQWANDHPDGLGAERYTDGSTYAGCYKAGMRHGLGSFFLVNGVGYTGSWKGGRRDGYGIIAVRKRGASALLPVFVCHTTAGKHLTVSKFKTDMPQHLLLLADCLMAVDAAQKQARTAQTQAFSEYFNRNEDAQNKRLEGMGVGVKAQNPMFKAFEQSSTYKKAKDSVVTKTRDFIRLSKVIKGLGGFASGEEKQNFASKIFSKKKEPPPKKKLATISRSVVLLAKLGRSAGGGDP